MAPQDLSPQDKLALVKVQLQEVMKEEILEDVIIKQNRPLKVYMGMKSSFHPQELCS